MPIGGKTLEMMRLQGKRPPGFIVVTDSRAIANSYRKRELYPLVFDPEKTYDWRVLHGLDVGLITESPRDKVAPTCLAILEAGPLTFNASYWGRYETEHDAIIPYASR